MDVDRLGGQTAPKVLLDIRGRFLAMTIPQRLLVYTRVSMFIVAIVGSVGFSVSHPEANAQLASTPKDAQQDQHMVGIDSTITDMKAEESELRHENALLSQQLSEDEGWAKGVGYLFGLISAGGLVLSFRTAKKA